MLIITISLKHHTADARQRIVSERVDLIDNLILSVSVTFLYFHCTIYLQIIVFPSKIILFSYLIFINQIGPPNLVFLKSMDKSTWNAKDVADSVLSDKSALVRILNREFISFTVDHLIYNGSL